MAPGWSFHNYVESMLLWSVSSHRPFKSFRFEVLHCHIILVVPRLDQVVYLVCGQQSPQLLRLTIPVILFGRSRFHCETSRPVARFSVALLTIWYCWVNRNQRPQVKIIDQTDLKCCSQPQPTNHYSPVHCFMFVLARALAQRARTIELACFNSHDSWVGGLGISCVPDTSHMKSLTGRLPFPNIGLHQLPCKTPFVGRRKPVQICHGPIIFQGSRIDWCQAKTRGMNGFYRFYPPKMVVSLSQIRYTP